MKVLFLGEVVGIPVVRALKKKVKLIKSYYQADFIFCNADGASDGYGILAETASELLSAGFDCLTSGDLIYNKRNIKDFIGYSALLRPYNLPPTSPGRGYKIFNLPSGKKLAVISLLGRNNFNKIFASDPYYIEETLLNHLMKDNVNSIIIDFHGGTTSELQSLQWLLAGKVSAVLGTHARVLTADSRILNNHTAIITGLGICGSPYSIAGFTPDVEILKIKSGRFSYSKIEKENLVIQGVLLDIDEVSGTAKSITPINKALADF